MYSNDDVDTAFAQSSRIMEVLAADFAILDEYEDACGEEFECDAFGADCD